MLAQGHKQKSNPELDSELLHKLTLSLMAEEQII
jgi:hypothetical protein